MCEISKKVPIVKRIIPKIIAQLKATFEEGLPYGPIAAVFNVFQGRCTFFGITFAIVGIIGFFKHYDLTSYSLMVGAIFTGLVAHSIKEDYSDYKNKQLQGLNGVHAPLVDQLATPIPTENDEKEEGRG